MSIGINTYTINGIYLDTLTAQAGCDSIVNSNLTINPAITSSQTIMICNGDSILVGSTYHYNTGIYIDVLTALNGCDSTVTTNLTESPVIIYSQNITMCYGDSVLVGSTYHYNTGTYVDVLTSFTGCDSTVTTNLTESPVIIYSQNITMCNDDSVLVGGIYHYNTGIYIDVLTALNGCDSSVTTNLTKSPAISSSQNITICNGDSVLVGSTYYYNSGNYTNVLTAANGCDSTVTTNLTESPAITSSQNITMCNGDSVLVGSTYYYNTGFYTTVLIAANGCDSTVTSALLESLPITSSQNITICNGDSILVGSTYYYNSGNYSTTLVAANGCDSIVTTNLMERPVISITQNSTICNGDSILVGSTYHNTTGIYIDTLTSFTGCDSIVTTNLTESLAITSSQNSTICTSDSILVGSTYHNTTGIYIDILTSFTGCDSTVTTNLIVNNTITTNQTIILCYGETLTIGTHSHTISGTYTDTLTAQAGCDSIVNTNLTISPAINSSQNITICNGDSILVGSTYYYNTGFYTTVLIAANGCDSTVTAALLESPAINSSQNITICNEDSVLVGSIYHYSTGVYVDVLTALNGCDSTVTTNLTENPSISSSQSITMCNGDSILVGNTYHYNTGIFVDVLTALNGCDSTVTTNLIEDPAIVFSQNVSICFEDTLTIGSNAYYTTGNYITIIPSATGCDSSITTALTVNPLPVITLSPDISISLGTNTILTANGASNYSWTPAATLNTATGNIVTATPAVPTTYCVNATDNNGCSDTKCMNVIIDRECGELFIPNAFSPNGDGSNDVLSVYINEHCVKKFSLLIYDRLGEKVFESDNINQTWDGTYNGKALDNAVFVYFLNIELTNQSSAIKQSGNVSIVK